MTQLLNKEKVYSRLNDENISDKNYEYDQEVWDTFKMQDASQYCDLYLKTDVQLLANKGKIEKCNTLKIIKKHLLTYYRYTWWSDSRLKKIWFC